MKTIVIPIVVGIIIYLLSAFIAMDFNPSNYDMGMRFIMVLFWVVFSAFGMIIWKDIEKIIK